jgi:hypothetical protein
VLCNLCVPYVVSALCTVFRMPLCVLPQPLYPLASPSAVRLTGLTLHLPSSSLQALRPVAHSHCLTCTLTTSCVFNPRIVHRFCIRYAVSSPRIAFAPCTPSPPLTRDLHALCALTVPRMSFYLACTITAPHALIRAPHGLVISSASAWPFACRTHIRTFMKLLKPHLKQLKAT